MQAKPKPTKLEWLEIALLIAPFLYLAARWDSFPARVPIHWGVHGEVNGWASKSAGLFLLPATNVFVWAILRWLPLVDPKVLRSTGEERVRAMSVFRILRTVLLLFLFAIFCAQAAISQGYPVSMNAIALNGCLLVFIVLGNFSSKLRPNYFVGIRTPWTLENPETWRATHRVGGRIMVFGSLALLAAEFFVGSQVFTGLVLAYILGLSAWALFYSWNYSRTHSVAR
jgi:uncharacterized membrane protein